MNKLTVLDFFCGAGGLTEGFRQMGFNVLTAVDNWDLSLQTHKLNHPETEIIKADVLNLDSSNLPKADVIIGGPPCTEFSGSKRGGKGDFDKGLKLVYRYLYFVNALKPKYWIMENVPRLSQAITKSIPFRKLGIDKDGNFEIPEMNVLCAADYGAPQLRKRLISGFYPLPKKTHFGESKLWKSTEGDVPWVNMRHVIENFPNPLSKSRDVSVKDPNYGFSIPVDRLTNHFTDNVMSDAEAARNRRQKTDHAYYGKMVFPDNLDRPARTVMATQFNASRETMVIECKKGGKVCYRKPTVREAASLQCFPITYQFLGSETQRYKQVGNAVPVKLASALAKAILIKEGMKVPEPIINKETELIHLR